ncbi:MAG: tRNA threonylcarbamoyladenosine dehydratase [Clostridia bacterium]|jgi:tRNA A37 threonylcarbamoyladenosine dehydratase|nr:tRNA threonylcarbamoyladenosine dehydratase [Clostridia bacterium]
MLTDFSRSKILLGDGGLEKLAAARVAVFGIGGVGGYAVEALARSGVGELDLIDNDKVSPSNVNRQIIALGSTLGRYKTEVMRERIADINPQCKVNVHNLFFLNSTAYMLDFSQFDYVLDAIDTVAGKIEIIAQAKSAGAPVISCMGAGNKLDPTRFEVADIEKTAVCPLARVMRRELKKLGISGVKVVYSKEEPLTSAAADGARPVTGSVAFVPSVAGLIAAGEIIKDLCGNGRN